MAVTLVKSFFLKNYILSQHGYIGFLNKTGQKRKDKLQNT